MSLIKVNIPGPKKLRGGWAIKAAIDAAQGGSTAYVYAKSDYWYYSDGGGNWACLRFRNKSQAVLFGHDHEYSRTYFREAAVDFGERETDLLDGAPEWWQEYLEIPEYGPYIGFIYGWGNGKWSKANYPEKDGFKEVGLLRAISIVGKNSLSDSLVDVPEGAGGVGLWQSMSKYISVIKVLRALVSADADITVLQFEKLVQLDSREGVLSPAVYPVADAQAGVTAARNFLAVKLD